MQLSLRITGEAEGLKPARGLAADFLGDQLADADHLVAVVRVGDDEDILAEHVEDWKIVRREAAEAAGLLGNFSIGGLSSMNADFIRENISPGGSADMLSLTIFIESIINNIY